MAHKLNLRMLAFVLAVMTLVVCLVACSDDKVQEPQRGEFVPPPFDSGAVEGTPDIADPTAIGYTELDAQAYKLSVCGLVTLNGDKADLYLTNPDTNNVWIKIRIFNASGDILAETGLIRPGEYLQTVTFKKIPDKGDKIVIRVMSYEPDTYYSKGEVTLNTVVS